MDDERKWRLKSRALWSEVGYQNTKFFHTYARFRKNQNTIWELSDFKGNKVCGFFALTNLVVIYFKKTFKKPKHMDIGEVLKLVGIFPRLIDEEENEAIYNPVSKDEFLIVIKTFKKANGLAPYGWTMKFFADFFEVVGDDLLRVVEEVRW